MEDLTKFYTQVKPFFDNNLKGTIEINHKKAKKEYYFFLLNRNRTFNFSYFFKIAKEFNISYKKVIDPLFSMLEFDYGALINRLDNRLAFRFYIDNLKGGKKRTAINILELETENLKDSDYKDLKDNWNKYKSKLYPNFGRVIGTYLMQLFIKDKPFTNTDFENILNNIVSFDLRIMKAELTPIFSHFRESLHKSLKALYDLLDKVYKTLIFKAYSYTDIIKTPASLFSGIVYVMLQKLGPFKHFEDTISNPLVMKITDLVAVALKEESVVLNNMAEASKTMRMLRGNIRTDDFAKLSRQLSTDLRIGYEDHLDLLNKLLSIQNKGITIEDGDDCLIDSTSLNTDSKKLSKVAKGKNSASNNYRNQIRMSGIYHRKSNSFLAIRLDEGNKVDTNLGNDLLDLFVHTIPQKINVCLDRGYYCKSQLSNLITSGYRFTILAKNNGVELQKLILDTWSELHPENTRGVNRSRSHKNFIAAVQKDIQALKIANPEYIRIGESLEIEPNVNIYATLFRVTDLYNYYSTLNDYEDKVKLINNKELDVSKLEKSCKKYISPDSDNKGQYLLDYESLVPWLKIHNTHCIITNYPTEKATEITEIYNIRSFIEKVFKALKIALDFSTAKVQLDDSLKLKIYVSTLVVLIKLSISDLLENKICRNKKYKDLTVEKVIAELFSIEAGIVKNYKNKDKLQIETLQKQQREAIELFGVNSQDFMREVELIYERAFKTRNAFTGIH